MGNLVFLAATEGLYRPATFGGVDLGQRGRGGGSGSLPSDTELDRGLEDFWEKLKHKCFARFGDSNGVQKL
jgi:hypothetical protein